MVRHFGLAILALSFAAASGCHVGCCSKRASEKNCPTDIRKMHCWCFGEDALFRYPCGPTTPYYGHKPTCWREWPTSASHWRDIHCGPVMPPMGPCAVPGLPVMLPIDGRPQAPTAGSQPATPPAEPQQVPPQGELPVPTEHEPPANQDVPADNQPEPQAPAEGQSSPQAEPTEPTSETPNLFEPPQSEANQSQESQGARENSSASTESNIATKANTQNEQATTRHNPWRPLSDEGNASGLQFQSSLKLESDPKSPAPLINSSRPSVEESETAAKESPVRTVQAEVKAEPVSPIKTIAEPAWYSDREVIIEDYRRIESKATEQKPAAKTPAVPPTAKEERQPAAALANNAAKVSESEVSNSTAWRPKTIADKAAGLRFQGWPALDSGQQPSGPAQTSGWIVVEQSETAARENPLGSPVTTQLASPPDPPMATPARYSNREVIIDDQNAGEWKKAEPMPALKATVASTPEMPKHKPSIEAETSAALQRFISHEKQDAAR